MNSIYPVTAILEPNFDEKWVFVGEKKFYTQEKKYFIAVFLLEYTKWHSSNRIKLIWNFLESNFRKYDTFSTDFFQHFEKNRHNIWRHCDVINGHKFFFVTSIDSVHQYLSIDTLFFYVRFFFANFIFLLRAAVYKWRHCDVIFGFFVKFL